MIKIIYLLISISVFISSSSAGEILCIDPEPIYGGKCVSKQEVFLNDEQKLHAKKVKAAVSGYLEENCVEKLGVCVEEFWIDYCDPDIGVCSALGEGAYDTGTFGVLRITYSTKKSGWVDIEGIKVTDTLNYPD